MTREEFVASWSMFSNTLADYNDEFWTSERSWALELMERFAEYQWPDEDKHARYEQYLKLKKEFENQ